MITELANTNAQEIASVLSKKHRSLGPASGMVLTLIVITSPEHLVGVISAAMEAGRTHPSRVITCSYHPDEQTSLDADLRFGEQIPGDLISIRLKGDLVNHGDSVVLPLLLPDVPIVVWWPNNAPADLVKDPIGKLAQRRITDISTAAEPLTALRTRAAHVHAGDSDLSWTRITPWRALLAAALDQYPCTPTSVCVEAVIDSIPARLLGAWLKLRLNVPIIYRDTAGPGITSVRLTTTNGEIAINRKDGFMANYLIPNQVPRSVALKRRGIIQLLTEELQHMDLDDVFPSVLKSAAGSI